MSEQNQQPKEKRTYGIIITGITMDQRETKKGGYILSVAAGGTMCKILSDRPGTIHSEYKGVMRSMLDGGMFMEASRA